MARTPSRGRSVRWLARSHAKVISAMNQGRGQPATRLPDQRRAGNTPRGDRNFPDRLSPPAGCKCISEPLSPGIERDSEFDPRKIPYPPSLLPASGAEL